MESGEDRGGRFSLWVGMMSLAVVWTVKVSGRDNGEPCRLEGTAQTIGW